MNRHINPDRCLRGQLQACARSASAPRIPRPTPWSLEEVWHRAGEGWSEAVTEFHIVGGLHPELTLDWYCEMLRGLKQRFPEVHLKAFTMVEVAYLAQRGKLSIRETLDQADGCRHGFAAGRRRGNLQRSRAAHHLRSQDRLASQWLESARTAHQLGLKSNCTMLYGHIENEEDRVDHLVKLRELAGRDRRLSDLHSAGVPSRQYARSSTFRTLPDFWI